MTQTLNGVARRIDMVLEAKVEVIGITADLRYSQNKKGSRVNYVTHAGIFYGKGTSEARWLGEVKLGGRWTEAQVLAEFKNNHKRWGQSSVPLETSVIRITLGSLLVASYRACHCIDYSHAEALEFFKNKPHFFDKGDGWETARLCRLVA